MKGVLTQDNITDTAITLSFDNFELLCFDCHNKEHNANASIRAPSDADERKTDWLT
ncbi:MAG: HNH endonuclease [Eggerthella lenta]